MAKINPSARWLYNKEHKNTVRGCHPNSALFDEGDEIPEDWFDNPDFIESEEMRSWPDAEEAETIEIDGDQAIGKTWTQMKKKQVLALIRSEYGLDMSGEPWQEVKDFMKSKEEPE